MINPNGSDIAGARRLLHQALPLLSTPTLTSLVTQALAKMDRAKPTHRAANKHRGWSDPNLKQDILNCIAAHPDWTRQQVSIFCNTNTARVSEVATGLV